MSVFVDEHRDRFGVEPICKTLEISASAYYQRAKGERSPRAIEDERLPRTPPGGGAFGSTSDAGGGTRTPDTRIMIAPRDCGGVRAVTGFRL